MNSALPTPPQATPDRPWLGLANFTAADEPFFFGRSSEIRELTDRVRRSPLTVLYGVSGYGKSSIIGAGVIPQLTRAGHSITLLRRCYDDLPERSLVTDVIDAVGGGLQAPTLWQFFHDRTQPWFQRSESGDSPAAPVLILDQFEEIFTKGEDRDTQAAAADARAREHAQQFLAQLADLVENRPPCELLRVLDEGSAEEKRALLRQYDFQAQPLRLLLALREDFLARLERQRRAMPSLMEHRIELRLLRGPAAFESVFQPGTLRPSLPPIIPADVAEAIVRAAAGASASTSLEEIDAVPPILSLLCERLNARRSQESISTSDFTADQAKRILEDFYEEKLQPHPRALREFLETKLTSPTGLRETVSLPSALSSLPSVRDSEPRLRTLVDDRILVIEDRGGIPRMEFTHDTLAKIAQQSHADRELIRRRTRFLIWGSAALVCLSALVWFIWSYHEIASRTNQLNALFESELTESGGINSQLPMAGLDPKVKANFESAKASQAADDTILQGFGLPFLLNPRQKEGVETFLDKERELEWASIWSSRSFLETSLAAVNLKDAEQNHNQSLAEEALRLTGVASNSARKAYNLAHTAEDKFKYLNRSIRLRYRVGEQLERLGRTEEALKNMRQAMQEVGELKPWHPEQTWDGELSVKMAYYKNGEARVLLNEALRKQHGQQTEFILDQAILECIQAAAEYDLMSAKSLALGKDFDAYSPYFKAATVLEEGKQYELAKVNYSRQLEHWDKVAEILRSKKTDTNDPDYSITINKGRTYIRLAVVCAQGLNQWLESQGFLRLALETFQNTGAHSTVELLKAKGRVHSLWHLFDSLDQWLKMKTREMHLNDQIAADIIKESGENLAILIKEVPSLISAQSKTEDSQLLGEEIMKLNDKIRYLNGTLQTAKKADDGNYLYEIKKLQRDNHDLATANLTAIQMLADKDKATKTEIYAFAWAAMTQEDLTGGDQPSLEKFNALRKAIGVRRSHLKRLTQFTDAGVKDIAFAKTCLAGSMKELAALLIAQRADLEPEWIKEEYLSLLEVPPGSSLYGGSKVLFERALSLLDQSDVLLKDQWFSGWYRGVVLDANQKYIDYSKELALNEEQKAMCDERRWRILKSWSESFAANPNDQVKGAQLLSLALAFEQFFIPPNGRTDLRGEDRLHQDATPEARRKSLDGISEGMKAMKAVQNAWARVMGNDFESEDLISATKQIEENKRNTWYSCDRIIRFWAHASLECLEKGESGPTLRELADALSMARRRLRLLYDHGTDWPPETPKDRKLWVAKQLRALLKFWSRISKPETRFIEDLKKAESFVINPAEDAEWKKLKSFLDGLQNPQ